MVQFPDGSLYNSSSTPSNLAINSTPAWLTLVGFVGVGVGLGVGVHVGVGDDIGDAIGGGGVADGVETGVDVRGGMIDLVVAVGLGVELP